MNRIPEAVQTWLWEQHLGEVANMRSVGGGCINNGVRLQTTSGDSFFLKTNVHAPADMFAREAEGLAALRQVGGLRVPETYLHGKGFLLMEDLNPAARKPGFSEELGRGLAALHNHTAAQFGFAHDNYIGATPQINSQTTDGYAFFARQRLLFQATLAQKKGYLSVLEVNQVEALGEKLPELVPRQPASLLHGDLWGGNVISDEAGAPVLIDPAVHYGWAEAELAFTGMFGGFDRHFYQAYQEERPLAPGWRERFPLYNLYHLFNHLNLFGGGYLTQVQEIIQRYT